MLIRRKIVFDIDDNGCFNCTSHKPNKDGYRILHINHKTRAMHRYIYEECFGEIPKGLVIRHTCDNKNCINPEHLITGTIQDNNRDSIERNRLNPPIGERNYHSKLKECEVVEILKSDLSLGELAKKYNLTKSTVCKIKKRQIWKHVTKIERGK